MPPCLIGWLGFGVDASDAAGFVECVDYRRLPIAWNSGSGVEASQIATGVDITGPADMLATWGGVFDQENGGYCLAWFGLTPPFIRLPGRIPGATYLLTLHMPVQHMINATARNPDAPDVQVARLTELGTLNGRPLTAASRLVVAGGRFWPRASYVRRSAAAAA
jgi:hypothetical protein